MQQKGEITSWNDVRSFGFITPANGDKQAFMHIHAFQNREKRPEVGQQVHFEMSRDHKGRPCAQHVVLEASSGDFPALSLGKRTLSIIGAVVFLAGVGIAAFFVPTKSQLPVYIAGISIVTFIVYAIDKAAAMRNAWRIPETTLHLLALVGGWPGALIAQQTIRHKSSKPSFQALFWVTVVLNCAAIAYFFTPDGGETLQPLLKEVLSEIR
jgi:uncharacterized membrane protein YsdA (DUF1294 family)/cold shock CspA family protein